MSKNISIAEGGVARQFTNDKLKINLVGGGTEYYVPESSVQLTTKSVTQNGTYKASDVGKYGFSQFSVNVRGGNGSADSSGKPNTSGTGPLPGGSGSAVVGTDPETGNDYAVGVDENGNLVQTPVPSGIKILKAPDKTDYVYQKTINYAGIVVHMRKKDDTDFTDNDHLTGLLSLSELIFPVTEAPAGSSSDIESFLESLYSMNANEQVFLRNRVPREPTGYTYTMETDTASYACIGHLNGGYCEISFATVPFKWRYHGFHNGSQYEVSQWMDATKVIDGLYAFYDLGTFVANRDIFNSSLPTVEQNDIPSSAGNTATIPVQWLNPYTGETHQDTFEITSTPSSGSSSTTTGSSGTEGSGGGGTF